MARPEHQPAAGARRDHDPRARSRPRHRSLLRNRRSLQRSGRRGDHARARPRRRPGRGAQPRRPERGAFPLPPDRPRGSGGAGRAVRPDDHGHQADGTDAALAGPLRQRDRFRDPRADGRHRLHAHKDPAAEHDVGRHREHPARHLPRLPGRRHEQPRQFEPHARSGRHDARQGRGVRGGRRHGVS